MALCNARLRRKPGHHCRGSAMANGRCRLHGGKGKGPVTPEGKARTEAARQAGYARYIAGMRQAKALGIIDLIPGGRNGKGGGTKQRFRIIEAAQEIAVATIKALPAPVETPFEQQSMGEQLATVTRMSLSEAHRILTMECDPENLKLLSIKKDTALSLIATQVRVDESVMRRQSADRLPAILARMQVLAEMAHDEPKTIDADISSPHDGRHQVK